MNQQGALLVTIAIAVVLVGFGVWAWIRRARRDAALVAPVGEVPPGVAVRKVFKGLYVATTKHANSLERLAIRGLDFRSKADLTVTDAGIALDLTGKPRVYLDAARLAGVAQATVAIDRVVEPDGLVRIEWRTDDGTVVDSYFRPQDASAWALADAVADILIPTQTSTPTGSDA